MLVTTTLTKFDRNQALNLASDTIFDLIVIGGGITGAGVLLDASSRGLKTILVEKADFASGTSSKSSKLVHGGLRYLQQKDFSLVYEALLERQHLLKNAPHLVSPLRFVIPLFGKSEKLIKALGRFYNAALWAYDLTGGIRIGKLHKKISKSEALKFIPSLKEDNLHAAFLYWDAQADDARLTITIIRTAVEIHGGVAINYCKVTSIKKMPEFFTITCEIADKRQIEIRAKSVINATGVFTDEIRALDEGIHPKSITPAKGIHIAVRSSELACNTAAVIPVPKDKRSIFIIPWYDYSYIGTTDNLYEGPLDDPSVTLADVQYLLDAVNHFANTKLTFDSITGFWSGLRPLLASESQSVHSKTQDMSRRHSVLVSSNKVVTITGGKLTTYRKMAEDAVDKVIELMQWPQSKSKTKNLPLLGYEKNPLGDYLCSRYGKQRSLIQEIILNNKALDKPIFQGLPYIFAEAEYSLKYEMVLTLDDLVSRRMRASLLNLEATLQGAYLLKDLFKKYGLANEAQFNQQVENLRTRLESFNKLRELS